MAQAAETAEIVELNSGKTRLIKVAMRLFADKGFDGVTVRDIATAAGVSAGLISHHFGSKEGLRDSVDRYFLSQFEEVLTQDAPVVREGDSQGLEVIVEWVESWISRHISDWDISKAYMRRALLEGSDWGVKLFERFYQVVRTSVDRMDADGRLRPDVDRLWLPLLIMYMELGTCCSIRWSKRYLAVPALTGRYGGGGTWLIWT